MKRLVQIPAFLWALASVRLALGQASVGDVLTIEPEPELDACLSHADLKARVDHWLGEKPLAVGLRVVVHTDDVRPWFSVWRGEELVAERRFDALPKACAELRDTLAMAIAIGIESAGRPASKSGVDGAYAQGDVPSQYDGSVPATTSRDPADARAARKEPETPADSDARTEDNARGEGVDDEAGTEQSDDEESPSAVRSGAERIWRIHGGTAVVIETLPEPFATLGVGAEWQFAPSFHVALSFLASLPFDVELDGIPVHSRVLGGRTLICFDLAAASASLEACSGLLVAHIAAQGEGFDVNESADMAWVAAPLRLGVRWPARSTFSLRAAIDAHLHLVRPQLLVLGGPDDTTLAVGLSASIEVVFTFP